MRKILNVLKALCFVIGLSGVTLGQAGEAEIQSNLERQRRGDIDGDGVQEIVKLELSPGTMGGSLLVTDANGNVRWRSNRPFTRSTWDEQRPLRPMYSSPEHLVWHDAAIESFFLVDIDGDGADEVVSSLFPGRGPTPFLIYVRDWNGDGFTLNEEFSGKYICNSSNGETFRYWSVNGPYPTNIYDGGRSRWTGSYIESFRDDFGQGRLKARINGTQRGLAVVERDGTGFKISKWLSQESASARRSEASASSSGLILSQALSRQLSESDLRGLSAKQLTLARNEIYAFHGRAFNDPDLRKYFASRPWYRMNPRYSDKLVPPLQKANAQFIADYQRRKGLNW